MTKLQPLLNDLRIIEEQNPDTVVSVLVVKRYSAREAVQIVRGYCRNGYRFLDSDGKIYKRKDKVF